MSNIWRHGFGSTVSNFCLTDPFNTGNKEKCSNSAVYIYFIISNTDKIQKYQEGIRTIQHQQDFVGIGMNYA